MSKLDIRNNTAENIDVIVFADDDYGYGTQIRNNYGEIRIEDYEGDVSSVVSGNLPNLILALQKAGELGWAN